MINKTVLDETKQELIKNCNKCDGGCTSCLTYCSFVEKMAIGGIPADYWFREMKDFYGDKKFKNKVIEHIGNIKGNMSQAKSLFFSGHSGTGKTMAACCVLKEALLNKYSIFYVTLSQMVSSLISNDANTKVKLFGVDFLVIDEVDQRFFPTENSQELFGTMFENIIRYRFHNIKPVIMCTNSVDVSQIFEGAYGQMFESLRSQFMINLFAGGKDARRNQ